MSQDRILIVKLSAIGDVIHTLPCLNALRTARPEAEIGWLVQEPSAQLLRDHPQLDHLIIFPRKQWGGNPLRILREAPQFVKRLRQYRFNVAIDFQGLTKSGVLTRLSGAKRRIGYGDRDGRELNKRFTNEKVVPEAKRVHTLERNLALLKPLGIDVQSAESVLPIPIDARERVAAFFEQLEISPEARIVALNPGAGWVTKRWPLDSFAQLGVKIQKELNEPVLLVWGPGEFEMVDEIAERMKAEGASPHIAPSTNLPTLAALLNCCAVMVSGDTGPLHLAAALNVRCVGIFGASDGRRNGPYNKESIVLQNRDVPCVPCWQKQCDHRPIYECLRSISAEDVFEATMKLLAQ